ncbi:hypothetical protein AMAG_04038 [Allomyces macrogynus ATCC 38327]|uniref:Importin subunit alpha n=1 Tax=Allomyces macrogynus (strain ATCC 38327) TaxID=578462 RepID=A0A0L0S7K9_ALLM3|nr:hypothetical protein AMAG_04038 [Allomyces macrogynus ATCC 38327]|eukprot:KNE58467.1 hypothetical protein AMAG_04038 [Allomyces macrogynus ATCC 38327]
MMSTTRPDRAAQYKNRGAFRPDELRRRRDEQVVSLRRKQRDEHLAKRRNLPSTRDHDDDTDSEGDDDDDDDIETSEQTLENLRVLTEQVFSDNADAQLDAVIKFRKVLSKERNPPIDPVVNCGVVPRLVQFLESPDPKMQFEAAWALTNIASGTAEQTEVVLMAGAVPHFVRLLRAGSIEVREQCIWALGNIAGDGPVRRDHVLQQGIVEPLIEVLAQAIQAAGTSGSPQAISMLRNGTWVVSNLCRGKNPQPAWALVRPLLPLLARLLYVADDEVLTDAAWAASYLSDGENYKIQALIESGMVTRLVELLRHPLPTVQTPALRAVGNVATGDDNQTQVVLNCGALPALAGMLRSSRDNIRKEVCWTISNITAGTTEQIQQVIDANLIPPLVQVLQNADFKTKKEACWAVSNATSGAATNPLQMRYLVNQGVIKPLCDLLASSDVRAVSTSLDAIENILKAGEYERAQQNDANPLRALRRRVRGVPTCSTSSRTTPTPRPTQQSFNIIQQYFDYDDEDDEQVANVDEHGQFTFDMSGGGQGQTFSFN